MSELKATTIYDAYWKATSDGDNSIPVYLKEEADKVIAEKDAEIAQLQAMLEERNRQIGELKDRITPKQSDRPLQERLNEVCKKHGVSTLQDLDWAFCESEKRRTKDNIEAAKELSRHKYKRCLDKAEMCQARYDEEDAKVNGCGASWEYINKEMKYWERWRWRWDALAENFKPNNSTAQ